jgi:lipoprotein-anchoring transpeptidase ErfK/SrfK
MSPPIMDRRVFGQGFLWWTLAAVVVPHGAFAAKKKKPVIAYEGAEVVEFPTPEKRGTVIVNTGERALYHVIGNETAIRYGVAVGKEGFDWAGIAKIGRKVQWPTWTPPKQMIARKPELWKWRNGMPGGPDNPLGARALYLYANGRDTLFRIHGTNEPWSIGQAASSGCIRMLNSEVAELYENVKLGTKVIVL